MAIVRSWEFSKRFLLLITILGGFFCSCGKSNDNSSDNFNIGRRGATLASLAFTYFDGSPQQDASGKELVFLSGMNQPTNLKIWKWNKATGAGTAAQRVTDQDTLGSETQVALSPDGNWLAIGAAGQTGVNQLYIQSYADATLRVAVNVTLPAAGYFSDMAFSPNTSSGVPLLLFTVHHLGDSNQSREDLYWATFTNSGSTLAISNTAAITTEASDTVGISPVISNPAADQFQVALNEKTGEQATIEALNLSYSAGSVSVSSRQALKTFAVGNGPRGQTVLGGGSVFYVKNLPIDPAAPVTAVPLGNNADIIKGKVTIGSQIIALNSQSLAETAQPIANQFEVVGVKASQDGAYVLSLGTQLIACQQADIYGRFLTLYNVQTGQNLNLFFAQATAGVWSVVADPCSLSLNATTLSTMIDNQLESFSFSVVAADPRPFKIAYQSRYRGDEQVMSLEFAVDANFKAADSSFLAPAGNKPATTLTK